MIRIDDPGDERIMPFRVRDRALNTRADRRESVAAGLFVAEGDLVVGRALDARCTPVMAFVDADDPPPVVHRLGPGVALYCADEAVRRDAMGFGVALSVVALFRRPAPRTAAPMICFPRVIALEAIDNPVNIGTVVRSAAALGWDGLLLDRTCADPLARRALRVSMGNSFALPFARAASLLDVVAEARNRGSLVVALTPASDAVALDALRPAADQRVLLLLGSERRGLSEELMAAATVRATIPMESGVDSLNVAAAAAIACYQLRAAAAGAGIATASESASGIDQGQRR
ncbi:MAG: RNA methyltransferase [Ilumatobacteraceae bacterium]